METHARPDEAGEGTEELETVDRVPGDGRPDGEIQEAARARPVGRLAAVVAFAGLAAAVMTGGMFVGMGPRIWAAVAVLLGVATVPWIRKVRNPIVMNVGVGLAVVVIGILMTVPAGSVADVVNLGPFVREAVTSGDVQRPPVEFTLGWRAILGWLMGGLGVAAAWVAIEFRRPALGLLLPLPIVAAAAISVPDEARLASGIAALALYAVAMGVLSGIELEEGEEQRSLAFELRRAARALPLIGVITAVLFLLGQMDILFPAPRYDPTQAAQKPKAVPISDVPDRVLFSVSSSVTGPWRMGSLDIYDGRDWRLPPFAEHRLREVPRDGILDSELQPGVKATFEVAGLEGAVLPGLPNLVGLIAEGPQLAYDSRTGNIRLAQGSIQPGLRYTVTAARIPSVDELQEITADPPREIEGISVDRFLDIPSPPPAVAELLTRAPEGSGWERLDFLRNELLKTVVATGAGVPVSVTPERVQDMLAGAKEGTPYEIVAAQAMLARWAGVPARIGYGFDGGEEVEGAFEVRPRHGASFLEVYFPGFKWLPIVGTPQQAKTSFGNNPTQLNESILASDDFAVSVFVPFETDPRGYLFQQIRALLSVLLPILGGMLFVYIVYPAIRKVVLRARRRAWAQRQGPAARIAVGYADFRDLAIDFGYRYEHDTPLAFLDRVVPDEEHRQFAWLVTRVLWGNLRDEMGDEDVAAAEELSRSLRKRLSQAHPWTLRLIATLSRLSLRHPYAPQLGVTSKERVTSTEEERDLVASASA